MHTWAERACRLPPLSSESASSSRKGHGTGGPVPGRCRQRQEGVACGQLTISFPPGTARGLNSLRLHPRGATQGQRAPSVPRVRLRAGVITTLPSPTAAAHPHCQRRQKPESPARGRSPVPGQAPQGEAEGGAAPSSGPRALLPHPADKRRGAQSRPDHVALLVPQPGDRRPSPPRPRRLPLPRKGGREVLLRVWALPPTAQLPAPPNPPRGQPGGHRADLCWRPRP